MDEDFLFFVGEIIKRVEPSADHDNIINHIQKSFGGELVYIKKNRMTEERNLKIIEEYKSGTSKKDLAKKYNMTLRNVYRII